MSRWGGWSSFPRAAKKKPPPESGIKLTKAGTTWWGQRWIEALEVVLRGDASRLARGRTYARAGRTHDLVIKGGQVTAKVTGSRATPYKIAITLTQLPADAWTKAIVGMAAKAQFAAELLAGQMPKEIDEVFRAAGSSLFPAQRTDLVTGCSCPDWGDPCKHVAATHYVLGEALDRDPFLLFELRGRTRTQVLDALRVARAGEVVPVAAAKPGRAKQAAKAAKAARGVDAGPEAGAPQVPTVTLGKLTAADYDRAREPVPTLTFSFEATVSHGAVIRQLGVPAAWGGNRSPVDALGPLVRRAAETARRIAMAEPEPPIAPDEGTATSPPPKPSKPRRGVARPPRR